MSSAKSLVKNLKPGQELNGMAITADLKEMYRGREHLLITRAKYPTHCREAFDAVGLCQLKELTPFECKQAWAAFGPCATELHQKRIVAARLARLEARKKKQQKQTE